MGETTKVICSLFFAISAVASMFPWSVDRPDSTTWVLRIVFPVVCFVSLGVILALHFRPDLEKDYLGQIRSDYFNRDGFCFAFAVTARDGIAFLDAYFQSQYDQPSHARIALHAGSAYSIAFTSGGKVAAFTFDVKCPPAGFGYIRMPIPIPKKLQGKKQPFEVGASVEYPEGKGRRVRFKDGIFLRENAKFENSFITSMTIAGAAMGTIILSKAAHTTIQFPVDVATSVPKKFEPKTKILWKLGQPELENAG